MAAATTTPTPAPPSTTNTHHTLTLPRNVIATLNPSAYLLAHLASSSPARPSGRSPTAFRAPSCTTSSLTHCAGSAVIRVGATAVVCGIQAEILLAKDIADPPRQEDAEFTAEDELARLQLLVPNVELATGCSPAHLPGGPPSSEAQTLAARLNSLLHSSRLVDLSDLKIRYTPPKLDDDEEPQEQTVAYWTLYASIHVLSLSGSASLVDVCWGALLAALRDVRLPRAWWDADVERVVASDEAAEARRLGLRGAPVACTWGVFGAGRGQLGMQLGQGQGQEQEQEGKGEDGSRAWVLADPDDFEDALCRETVTVTVDGSGGKMKILRIEKTGGSVVGAGEMRGLVAAAAERWKEWATVLGVE